MERRAIEGMLIIFLLLMIPFSGCQETSNTENNSNFVLINNMLREPAAYLDENVTVRGRVIQTIKDAYQIREEQTYSEIYVRLKEGVNASIKIGSEYYWTGTVKFGSCGGTVRGLYMEITKVEPIS